VVVELEGITELNHLLLKTRSDGNTLLGALKAGVVLLLTRDPDALCSRGELSLADGTADITDLVLEALEVTEELDVDGKEEVTKLDGDLLAVLKTSKSVHVVTGLEAAGHDLDEHAVTVALVSSSGLTSTTDGEAGSLADDEILQDLLGISAVLAVAADNPTLGDGLVLTAVHLDLATLHSRGGAIKAPWEGLVAGESEHERVGAEHGLDGPGGSDGRTGVGAAEADAALLGSHETVVASDTEVGGVTGDNETKTVLLSLVDSHLHALDRDDHTHTVVTINDGGGGSLLHNLEVGDGVETALADAVVVDELETLDTVGVHTATIGSDEDLTADLSILLGDALGLENVDHELLEDVHLHPRKIRCFETHFALLQQEECKGTNSLTIKDNQKT